MVGFRRPGSHKPAPNYMHATKEEKGPAERKKKQERKKGQVERGNRRDLNTLEARFPANFHVVDYTYLFSDALFRVGLICKFGDGGKDRRNGLCARCG